MSLQRKTLLAIAITFLMLFVVLFVVSQVIILNQFDQLQSDATHENVQRVLNTINKEVDNLSATNGDWSSWDDTYQFIQDGNADYIASNLTDDTFKNLHLNIMIYVNDAGNTVFGRAYSFQTQTSRNLPKELLPHAGTVSSLLNIPSTGEGVNKGLILSPKGPMFVASRAILDSRGILPAKGVLVMGRYFDEQEVANIAEQTQLSIKLLPLNSPNTPPDFLSAQSVLVAPDATSMFYMRNDQTAQGYALLHDYMGQPALILQVEMPANIYQAGQKTVFYLLAAMLISGVIIEGVIIGWIENRVLARLAFLDRRMIEIGNSDDLSARIDAKGNDELSRLAMTINESLAKREQSQEQKLRNLNTALKQANADLEEKIAALKTSQKYKDRFLSHASHELRTPLAIMGTRLYLARKKPDEWLTHLQVLEDTQQRLLGIIDDIFDMTRLQDNNLTLNFQRMDLKSFIPMIVEDVAPRFKQSNSSISQDFVEDALPVNMDVVYFGRACEKLLRFMLDFSGSNNEIVINLQKLKKDDQWFACIEMCSTAFHFDEEEIKEMFSPFYQASEGDFHTTGLDLAIAKQIIEVHHFSLIAHAEEDMLKGGCFQVMMPLATENTPQYEAVY